MTAQGQSPFSPGDPISSKFLNDVDATTRRSFGGQSPKGSNPFERTVVIVKKPDVAIPTLTVRQVAYDDNPPKPCSTSGGVETCSYQLLPREIEVYPDFGWTVEDYIDDWFEVGVDKLNTTATYLKAHFEHRTWRLQRPSSVSAESELALPVIQSQAELDDTEAITLSVIPVTVTAGPTGLVIELQSEEATDEGPPPPAVREVFCWPKLKRKDYIEMINANVPPILRIEKHDGLWFARQIFPFFLSKPERNRPAGGCIPR